MNRLKNLMKSKKVEKDKYVVLEKLDTSILYIEVVHYAKGKCVFTEKQIRKRFFKKTKMKQLSFLCFTIRYHLNQLFIELLNHYLNLGLEKLVLNGFKLSQKLDEHVINENNRANEIKELDLENLTAYLLEQFQNSFSQINFLRISRNYETLEVVQKVLIFNRIARLEIQLL